MPNFNFPVPPSPVYEAVAEDPFAVLPTDEEPMVYTTTGPLPVARGLAFSKNALVLDANLIIGVLNGGIYGSQGN